MAVGYSVTVIFDENIDSVVIPGEGGDVTYNTSGESKNLSAVAMAFSGTVNCKAGYVIDTITNGTRISDFSFSCKKGVTVVTITSKQSTPTISFKHRFKNDTLIGTGTYKFRRYSVENPIITPQLAAPTMLPLQGRRLVLIQSKMLRLTIFLQIIQVLGYLRHRKEEFQWPISKLAIQPIIM